MIAIASLATQSGVRVSGLFGLVSVKRAPNPERGDRARVTIADATGFALCDVSLSDEGFLRLTDIRTRFVQIEGHVASTPSDVVRDRYVPHRKSCQARSSQLASAVPHVGARGRCGRF